MGNENLPVEQDKTAAPQRQQGSSTSTAIPPRTNRQAAQLTFPVASARIKGDSDLTAIAEGGTLTIGNTGNGVRKMQQILIDMGYLEATHVEVIASSFGTFTQEALVKFQKETASTIPFKKGTLDAATLSAMDQRLAGRQDYVQAAKPANANKNIRPVDDQDKAAMSSALEPTTKEQEEKEFSREESILYREELIANFDRKLDALYKKSLATNKKALLKNSDKRDEKKLLTPQEVEDPANVAAEVVNSVYGHLTGQPKGKAFTYGKNLIDIWEESDSLIKEGTLKEKIGHAKDWAPYLVETLSIEVNAKHGRSSTDNIFMKTLAKNTRSSREKIDKLLEIQKAWEATEQQGIVSIQRQKATSKQGNTKKKWEIFYTAMHEYIHQLAHSNFEAWAGALKGAKEHTLLEGFCDFFVLNVCAKFPPEKLRPYQERVEGSKDYNKAKPDPIPSIHQASAVYGAVAQAEQAVGVVGVANVQQAYFKGKVELMGGFVPKKKEGEK